MLFGKYCRMSQASHRRNPIETDIDSINTPISIGVAIKEKTATMSIDQLLSRADRAMYRAKQVGRNRVIIWNERDFQAT